MSTETNLNSNSHRLNSWVAVSVAIISAFLAVTKVKDDNIVQAMLLAKNNAVDTWSEYQSKRIKHHLLELGEAQAVALRSATGRETPELATQTKGYAIKIAAYEKEEKGLTEKARAYEKEYDVLNSHDDQFDMSDALLSISLAMLAVTSLTEKRWLFFMSWGFAGFGFVMGLSGLIGLGLRFDWITKLLS